MTLSGFFNGLGDIFLWTFQIFEIIENNFNYMLIALGFFGFLFWMRKQAQFNKAAANNSNQLK